MLQKPRCKAAFPHVHPLQSERLSVADSLGELQIVGSFSSLTRLDSKAKLPLCFSWSGIASISSTFNCLSTNGRPDLLQWKVTKPVCTEAQMPGCSFYVRRSQLPVSCLCLYNLAVNRKRRLPPCATFNQKKRGGGTLWRLDGHKPPEINQFTLQNDRTQC